MMQQHLFISQSSSSFYLPNREGNNTDDDSEEDGGIGISFNCSSSSESLVVPTIKLSPPCSGLARRRGNFPTEPTDFSSDSGLSLTDSHCSGYQFSS